MKLRIFQSDEGDCNLLQSNDGKNILCDGGLSKSMRDHVRENLGELIGSDGMLDYIYVSHIDQDHIQGVLRLLRDSLDWKVYDFHQAQNDPDVRKPKSPRPPIIGGLWHNAFSDQVDENLGEIGGLLAVSVPVMFGTAIPELVYAAEEALSIAHSIPQALKVSRLCKKDLLDIPVNLIPGSTGPEKLLYSKKRPKSFNVGSLKITIIGPSESELNDLRDGWNKWVDGHENRIKSIQKEIHKQIEKFSNDQLEGTPFDYRNWNGVPDFRGVSIPNVASLMFMVEENGKRLLLTGDSQQEKILEGLETAGYLDDGYIHLDALKVQHHGSEHNLDANFSRHVSADHYIFCGNGTHGNPEPKVLDIVYKSRMGVKSKLTQAPDAKGKKFTFWFSTNSDSLPKQSKKHANFEEVEELVDKWVKESNGLMSAIFVTEDFVTLDI